MHDIWTFRVKGGTPFAFGLPGNPRVEHKGAMSLFNLLLTKDEAGLVLRQASAYGGEVECRMLEGQTPEQHAERLAILGKGKEATVWPCAKCPGCFWFDPIETEPCGVRGWTPDIKDAAIKAHLKATDDLAECPIHGIEGGD